MAPPDDAEEALRSTNAKANFHRLTRLLMCGGVKLLRETFDSIHPPADLPVKLADPAIKAQLRGARLTQPEWVCLYPSTGVYGKSSDFDITLIFKLFRTICNLTPPPGPRGWDDLPNSTDHSLVADLVRIKCYRNEIHGHRHTMEISDIEFVHLWRKIGKPLLRIATNISLAKEDEWKKSIDDLRHNPLTPDEERCMEELETWYKQDMDVKNELEKLSGTVEEKFNTIHEELTWLKSQPPVIVVIHMNVESNTQTLQPQAGYHQAAGSEPMFIVPNLPKPERAVGVEAGSPDDPEPNNPPDINVWNVILSFKEAVDLFLRYLWCKLQVLVRNDEVGSWHVTVECSSLQILEGLWDDYRSGHLNSVAQEILITPQVLEKLGLAMVKLKLSISEDQYENGKKLFEASSGAEDRSETQGALQATFAKTNSEASIESVKQTDLLERISILEHENVELKETVKAIKGTFQSERKRISNIERENNDLRRVVENRRLEAEKMAGIEWGKILEGFRDSICLEGKISKIEHENSQHRRWAEGRILIMDEENSQLRRLIEGKISKIEQENSHHRRWAEGKISKIEQENSQHRRWAEEKILKLEKDKNELRRLIEVNQESRLLKENDSEERLKMLESPLELESRSSLSLLSEEKLHTIAYPPPLPRRKIGSKFRKGTSTPRGLERSTGGIFGRTTGFCQVIINRTIHEALVSEEDEIVSAFQSLSYVVDTATCTPNDDVEGLVESIAARDYNNRNIFVCFILSSLTENLEIARSKRGAFFFRDSAFNVRDLMAKFSPGKCLSLSGKPKVFIFLVHQKAAAPEIIYPGVFTGHVPSPGLCLFVPNRKGYLSTLLTEIKLHCLDLDLLSILKEAKKSFYEKTNITIPDPVHDFSNKVFLC